MAVLRSQMANPDGFLPSIRQEQRLGRVSPTRALRVRVREGWAPLPALTSLSALPAGRLVDALKNYEIIFYLAGSEVALAGIFMAVATNCRLRRPKDRPPSPGTEGGAGDGEEAEAEVDSDLPPAGSEEPGGLEAVEVPSLGAGPSQPEVKVEPGLDS